MRHPLRQLLADVLLLCLVRLAAPYRPELPTGGLKDSVAQKQAAVDVSGHVVMARVDVAESDEQTPDPAQSSEWCASIYAGGSTCAVPALDQLTAGSQTTFPLVSINPAVNVPQNLAAGDNWAVKYSSTFGVTTAGEYLFRVVTHDKDSVELHIDGAPALTGTCVTLAISKYVHLTPGSHNASLVYGTQGVTGNVSLSYLGPDTGDDCFKPITGHCFLTGPPTPAPPQPTPAPPTTYTTTIYTTAVATTTSTPVQPTGTNVCFSIYYSSEYKKCVIPNTMGLLKQFQQPVADINVALQQGSPAGSFETYLRISKAGDYVFQLSLDGNSSGTLWIDGHEVVVCRCCKEKRSGSKHFSAGRHHMSVLATGDGSNDRVRLSYQGPDTTSNLVPVPSSAYEEGVQCCDLRSLYTPLPGSFPFTAAIQNASGSGLLQPYQFSRVPPLHHHDSRHRRQRQQQQQHGDEQHLLGF